MKLRYHVDVFAEDLEEDAEGRAQRGGDGYGK